MITKLEMMTRSAGEIEARLGEIIRRLEAVECQLAELLDKPSDRRNSPQ